MVTKTTIKIIFIFLLAAPMQVYSTVDSLTNLLKSGSVKNNPRIYNELSGKIRWHNPELSLDYAKKAMNLAISNKQDEEELKALINIADSYYELHQFEDAVNYYNRALKKDYKNDLLTAENYLKLGITFKDINEFEKSLFCLNKALGIYKSSGNDLGVASCLNAFGSLEWKRSAYHESLSYYHQSLNIYESKNDLTGIAQVSSNIGLVNRDLSNFSQSEKFYNRALQIFEKLDDKSNTANTLNFIGSLYLRSKNFDKSEEFYQKALSYRLKTENKLNIASSYSNIALFYREKGEFAESLEYYGKALLIYRESKSVELLATTLNNMGHLHLRLNNFTKALEHYLEALNKSLLSGHSIMTSISYKNIGLLYLSLENHELAMAYLAKSVVAIKPGEDDKNMAYTLHILGNVYAAQDDHRNAISAYKQSLSLRRKIGDKLEVAASLRNLGNSEMQLNNFNASDNYLDEASKIYENLHDNSGYAQVLNAKGNLYERAGDITKALQYFEKTIDIATQSDNFFLVSLCARKAGVIGLQERNYDIALYHLKKSLKFAIQLENDDLKKFAYKALADYYEQTEDFRTSLGYYKEYLTVNERIESARQSMRVLDTQLNFELTRKNTHIREIEDQVELLEKENQIQLLSISKQKQIRNFSFILTALAVFIGFLFYSRYNLKRKAANMLSEKVSIIEKQNEELGILNSTKDKFFSIIAHDLKNPLTGLMGFTNHVIKNYDKLKQEEILEINGFINETSKNLYSLLDNLLYWARAQTGNIPFQPEQFDLTKVIESNVSLQTANAKQKNIEITSEKDGHSTVMADKNMMMLVVRNLLSNAVKFTEKGGKITIKTHSNKEHIYVSFEDNGIGMSPEQIEKLFKIDKHFSTKGTSDEEGTGLGLILCNEFIEMNKGSLSVKSNLGIGTIFTISVPNK